MYDKSAYSGHHCRRTRRVVSKAKCIQPEKSFFQRGRRLSCGIAKSRLSPILTLDLLPSARKAIHILHIRPERGYTRSLTNGKHLMLLLPRPLSLVEYNAKRMQNKGDDIISFGKYHGHYLHEILRIDPGYLTWIAFKFTPRIPKQERFAQIARIYHSVYIDILQRKAKQPPAGHFLGKEGEKVTDLTLTVLSVRLEDDPYKTQVRGTTPYFYVRQILRLKDTSGNLVTFRVNSRTASRHSCQLPAVEHAYRTDETVHIASARIAGTYTIGKNKWTRLNYVKIRQ